MPVKNLLAQRIRRSSMRRNFAPNLPPIQPVPYPDDCATFDQLRVRVPFLAYRHSRAAPRFATRWRSHLNPGVRGAKIS